MPDPVVTLVTQEASAELAAEVMATLDAHGFETATIAHDAIGHGDLDLRSSGAVVAVAPADTAATVELVRMLRRETHVALIVVADHGLGEVLAAGADDVVAGERVTAELGPRVRIRAARRAAAVPDRVELGSLCIDRDDRSVTLRGQTVDLTSREFDLLDYLVTREGRIVSRDQLLRDVWASSSEWQQERTVNEHVRRLRNKIGDGWIVTIRGYGYRFDGR